MWVAGGDLYDAGVKAPTEPAGENISPPATEPANLCKPSTRTTASLLGHSSPLTLREYARKLVRVHSRPKTNRRAKPTVVNILLRLLFLDKDFQNLADIKSVKIVFRITFAEY